MKNKEQKINEIKLSFFDAVLQLMEEACNDINAIDEDVDSVKEEVAEEKTVVKSSTVIRFRRGFFVDIWSTISEYIPVSSAVTAEEILKLIWKYEPMNAKLALEQYNSGNYNFSFSYYIMRALLRNGFIKSLRKKGLYVRADFIYQRERRRHVVNTTTSNVVINNSPVIKVVNK